MIRDLSGIDPREALGSEVDILLAMCQRGLVALLLGMLRVLPPISKPGGAPPVAPAGVPSSSQPSRLPYQGYRSDIVAGELRHLTLQCSKLACLRRCHQVRLADQCCCCRAVLANAAFGRPPVQEQISSAGGVEMLLEQCQVMLAEILVSMHLTQLPRGPIRVVRPVKCLALLHTTPAVMTAD